MRLKNGLRGEIMYNNVCKKCGSVELFSEQKGNNIGLYCSDCGAWIKWLGKDELRAYENATKLKDVSVDRALINNAYNMIKFLEGMVNKSDIDDEQQLAINIVMLGLKNVLKS